MKIVLVQDIYHFNIFFIAFIICGFLLMIDMCFTLFDVGVGAHISGLWLDWILGFSLCYAILTYYLKFKEFKNMNEDGYEINERHLQLSFKNNLPYNFLY